MHALQHIIGSLVRRTWLVALVAVLVCAAFAARAVAALVEASYLAPSLHGAFPAPRPTQAKPPRSTPDGTELVVRNMFCSTCEPVRGGPGPTDSFVADAMLIATSIGARGEARATVRVTSSEAQGSFGVGDQIPGVGIIEHIGWISIEVVDAKQRHARISLLPAVSRGDAGAATQAPAAAAEPWAGRIKKLDEHTYEVERELVRSLVSGSVKPGGARISPVTGDNGELKGLRMSGASQSSLPAALGLQNGDVLSEINGTHIRSANTLLDLYARLDQLNVVEIEGTRGGKPFAIELRLK